MKRQKNDQFFGHDEKFVFLAFFAWERDETKPYTGSRDAQLYYQGKSAGFIYFFGFS